QTAFVLPSVFVPHVNPASNHQSSCAFSATVSTVYPEPDGETTKVCVVVPHGVVLTLPTHVPEMQSPPSAAPSPAPASPASAAPPHAAGTTETVVPCGSSVSDVLVVTSTSPWVQSMKSSTSEPQGVTTMSSTVPRTAATAFEVWNVTRLLE